MIRETEKARIDEIMKSAHIIRSARSTTAVSIIPGGKIEIRTSKTASDEYLRGVISDKLTWIEEHLRQDAEHGEEPKLTMDDIRALADKALDYIPKRAAYYAPIVGVKYKRITIRNQKTKWGSCSENGNLNFNCILMLTPTDVIDSVVVHELCHLKYMNHSHNFYDEVLRVFPNYDECDKWLRENGRYLIARML